ncbi:hypothetical protein NBRC116188_23320 [Oceaniserpentilla sp. 4NH20-0058]|uniref:hypothetical protein n=1 Tax=Oceaniserpentilla sp. 4NH20-0058 TaxID=3127660 RepID=UPI0031070D09
MKKLPLIVMLLVLVAPFAVSLMLLDDKQKVADKARGEWLNTTNYIDKIQDNNWQIVWRNQDCNSQCDQWENLLLRVKMALGKNQNKVSVTHNTVQSLNHMDHGLFIANHKGLVLLSYQANESGAYNLLKDLKVLLKHNGK